MPVEVPTYDSFQVAPAALPDARVVDTQPGNAALELGQGEQQFGADAMEAAARIAHRENADAVFKAEATLKDQYLQFEQSVRQRQGTNAWGVTTDAANWWKKTAADITGSLQNDAQRQIFAHTAASLREQSLSSISAYENEQQHQSVEDSAKSSIAGSINIAAANPNDPNAVGQAKSDILKRLTVLKSLNGWTPERYQLEQGNALTDLHTQVIQSLVDTNPDAAKAYLDANRGEINGVQLDGLDKAVRTGTITQQSQIAATDILGGSNSESEALAQARAKYSGQVQDAIVTRIHERFAEQQDIQDRNEKNAADQAWHILDSQGYSAIPPSLLNGVNGETAKALRDEANRRASGENAVTDWSKFYQLRTLAMQHPDQFAKQDLRVDFSSLAPSERRTLIDLQAQLNAPSAQRDASTFNNQLAATHRTLGIQGKPPAMGEFDSQAMQAVQDLEQQLKRKPTFDERQQVLDKMMTQGKASSWWTSGRYYQSVAEGSQATFTPTIPDADRGQIMDSLKKRGVTNPTEQQITSIWRKWRGF